MPHTWDPDRYLTYADERGRPFVELVARIGAAAPARGRRPRLRARQPHRPARRALARRPRGRPRLQPGDDRRGRRRSASRVDYAVADLRDWRPSGRSTCWSATRPSSGCPATSTCCRAWSPRSRPAAGSPSRCPATSTSRATRSAPSWPPRRRTPSTPPASPSRPRTTRPPTTTRWPRPAARSTSGRRRTLHVLRGADPVFTWVSGTGARPTLQALPDDLRPASRRSSSAGWPRPTRPAPTAPCCCRSAGSSRWPQVDAS